MIDKEVLREKMNKKLRESKSPDDMYKEYLTKHVQGVKDVYKNIMYDVLLKESDLTVEELHEIEEIIGHHDESKYSEEEWGAYRDHFYDPEKNPRSGSTQFDLAWNHHQNSNPHHWQYWCLINDVDNPQVQPLDMPLKYIIEMLCDWQSAGNFYGNTAYQWYEKQKNRMILSENTREIVEKYIEYLK